MCVDLIHFDTTAYIITIGALEEKGSGKEMSASPFIGRGAASFACEEISLNTTEEVKGVDPPEPDVWNSLKRGSIKKEFNAGLRNPQAKLMNVETYNGGCVNEWGCVANAGFRCPRSEAHTSAIKGMYDWLQSPLLSGVSDPDLEYNPPEYMQGIKAGTANSITGWGRTADGTYKWAQLSRRDNPGVAKAFADETCRGGGGS